MFHVFVEGAKDGSAAGVKRLAAAIAQHYGLPAADIERRFASGRFRVKGNCDRATADHYKGDLELLGAICTIEAATAANSLPTPPAGVPVVRQQSASTPPTGLAAAGSMPAGRATPATGLAVATPPAGVAVSRTATPLPDGPARPSQPAFASGLSAAFSGEMPAASLGALENAASSLSLASVDGSDDAPAKAPEVFEPPAASLPASIGPAPDKPKAPEKKAKPKDEPVDLFMPPDAAEAELKVDLAGEEIERSAKKRASTPPPVDPQPPGAAAPQRRSQPSMPIASVTSLPDKPAHPLGNERVRLVAGIALAVVIGFVPAHLVASMREKSAYNDVDAKVTAIQADATTIDDWNRLDQMRDDMLANKKSSQRSIAILALGIWAAVGAGVAYGWFRRINWERFEA